MDERALDDRSPRKVLAASIPPELMEPGADVLAHADNLEELAAEFQARRFTYDLEQFLFPLFRPFYQTFPEVQEDTLAKLEDTGLSRELIHSYLTEMGDQPYAVLGLTHSESIPADVRKQLREESQRVMFETVKSQLGIASGQKD